MYNKLFTKILDSSIWLEPDHVRLVWITFLAVMDQDGYVQLAAIGNVAARARLTDELAADAIKRLESPDPINPGQPDEGRRIHRVEGGGWMVLSAKKYSSIVTAEMLRSQNRERASRYRARHREGKPSRSRNANVTTSDTDSDSLRQKKRRDAKVARETLKFMEGHPAGSDPLKTGILDKPADF